MTPAKRLETQSRDDAVWDGKRWLRKPTTGNRLAQEIRRVAARRTRALSEAEKAQAELLPLMDRARQEGPEKLSNGQLEDLTGYSRGHIPRLVADYRASQQTRNGEGGE